MNTMRKVALVLVESRIQAILDDERVVMLGTNVLDALHNVLDCIDQERELL